MVVENRYIIIYKSRRKKKEGEREVNITLMRYVIVSHFLGSHRNEIMDIYSI